MNLVGILIGTGILWLLKAVLVMPIAHYLTNRQLVKQAGALSPEGQANVPVEAIDTKLYILVDLLVMGTAGFLLGIIVGWFFIGITWEGKSWPGMIAFIGSSVLGSMMHG
jgi:hypothetical protein